jgi:hypothetical protein
VDDEIVIVITPPPLGPDGARHAPTVSIRYRGTLPASREKLLAARDALDRLLKANG